jgi:DUF2934 family protein
MASELGYIRAPDPYRLDSSQSAIDKLFTPEERHQRISEAAYCIAEQRGFAPGHELSDWLAAEKEVDRWCGLVEPSPQWDQRKG